jgi:hypothetical protein
LTPLNIYDFLISDREKYARHIISFSDYYLDGFSRFLFHSFHPRLKRNSLQVFLGEVSFLSLRTSQLPVKFLVELNYFEVVFPIAESAEVRIKVLEKRLGRCIYSK